VPPSRTLGSNLMMVHSFEYIDLNDRANDLFHLNSCQEIPCWLVGNNEFERLLLADRGHSRTVAIDPKRTVTTIKSWLAAC